MGEAKRRAKVMAELQTGLEHAYAEGQGVWTIEVFNFRIIPEILVRAASGDKQSHELAETIKSIVERIAAPPLGAHKPSLCLTCDTAFTLTSPPPAGFVVLRAANPEGRQLIASVLCTSCEKRTDCKQRVFEKVRCEMIQDAREINVRESGRS